MPKILKKIFLSFLVFSIIFSAFAPNLLLTKAAPFNPPPTPVGNPGQNTPTGGSWYSQGFSDWFNKVYDENASPGNEIFGERYTAAQVQWVVYSMFSFMLNSVVDPKITACFLTNSGNIKTCFDALKGLLQGATQSPPTASQPSNQNLLRLVFADRPISGITYVKERLNKFRLVPEAKAQSPGVGFDALKPVQEMWKASRDISFGLFVLAAVVLAFMIMFRIKIAPQVVISVQSAIPKLIISLILVTFSYAIAGFLIDLMYVVMGMFSLILPKFAVPGNLTPPQAFNMLTGVSGSTGEQWGGFGLVATGLVYLKWFTITLLALLTQTFSGIALLLGAVAATLSTGGLNVLLLILILVIVVIICIWNMIRAWWILIKAFANILLLTIFAPLQIVMGTFIPNFSFSSWLKSFASNLATFVGVGVLIQLSLIFLGHAYNKVGFGFTPEFFSKTILGFLSPFNTPSSPYWPPLLGMGPDSDVSIGLLFLGVSFVLFTLIPKVSDMIQSFMAGKPFAYGTGIGELGGPAMGYGLYGVGRLARRRLPSPFDWIFPGYRVPENIAQQAEDIRRPIETITEITRGARR